MLADKKSGELMRNFAGQWLHARSIETANVNAVAVAAEGTACGSESGGKRARFRELSAKDKLTDAEKKELETIRGALSNPPAKAGKGAGKFGKQRRFDLTPEIRKAMRQETEMAFEYIVREDRSLLELIDADYTFLNEKLAKHYGIDKVTGDQMRKVTLPPDSHSRRHPHAGHHADHDLESRSHLAGQARPVYPGQHSGHACSPAAARISLRLEQASATLAKAKTPTHRQGIADASP